MASPYLPTTPVLVGLQIPLLFVNNIVALAIGPQHQLFRVAFSLPILVLLVSQSLHRKWEICWGDHYALDNAVLLLALVYFDWIILANPDREQWRKILNEPLEGAKDVKESGKLASGNGRGKLANGDAHTANSHAKIEQSDVPKGFWSRAWWGVRLAFVGSRYMGWSCQVKNVPAVYVHPSHPRTHFIARRLVRLVFFYLLKDALCSWTAASPHGSWQSIKHLKGVVGFAGYSLSHRILFIWVQILIAYTALELSGSALSIVCVATGLSHPSECPTPFGSFKDLYNLRNAWSLVWHQQCRRPFSVPGIWLTRDVLHLRKGSFASKFLQLSTAFGLSAMVHAVASMVNHHSFNDDGSFSFFLAQIPLLMMEAYVIEFGKSRGIKDSLFWRAVGFVWTITVISVTSENWTDRLIQHGVWIHDGEVDWFNLGPKI